MDHKYFEVLDGADDSVNYFSSVILKLKNVISLDGAVILDVGCGTGKFVAPLLKICSPSIIGLDGPTKVANRAIERGYMDVKVVNDLSNVEFPFDDSSFDCVICKDVMEHLYDPLFTLAEINRVMRVNGIFLFHVPNHFPMAGRLRFLFKNDLDTFSFFQNESRWRFPHIRFFEYFDIINVLKNNGFKIVEDISYLFPLVPIFGRFKLFNPFAIHLIQRYPNQFSGAFTLLARKVSKFEEKQSGVKEL